MVDLLRIRKDQILTRLNREYTIKDGRLSRKNSIPITSIPSQNSIKSFEETRSEYIEKLKQRIKQLEVNPNEESIESIESVKSVSRPRLTSLEKEPKPRLPSLESIPKQKEKVHKEVVIKESISKDYVPEQDKSMRLVPCSNCNRKFRQERIETHESTCFKLKKKRPKFDEQKMRLKDTEMETFVRKPKMEPKKSNEPTNCPQCHRHFNETSIKTHIAICQKLANKPKRTLFMK